MIDWRSRCATPLRGSPRVKKVPNSLSHRDDYGRLTIAKHCIKGKPALVADKNGQVHLPRHCKS